MTKKYNYTEGGAYVSDSSPVLIRNVPAGNLKISVVKGDADGELEVQPIPLGRSVADVTIRDIKVYGCRIAVNTSNPSTRVTYPETIFSQTNKAYGKTPASGTGASCMNGWAGCELITGIKRQTTTNNGATWVDVSSKTAAVAGSSSQQVFTYFPTWWFKMTNDGTNIDLAFADKQIDSTWKDYAGSVGTNHVGHFRLGCYACKSDFKSHSGKPKVNTSLANFIAGAKALRTGMDIMTWYQWTYLGALATLLYKSTDLQSAMAQGCVISSDFQSESALTFGNDYGMAGSTSKTQQMAFFWVQNMWGNIYQWCGGAQTDSTRKLMTCTGYSSLSDRDFDKTSLGGPPSTIYGSIVKVVGTTDAGFFPSATDDFLTTYFVDTGYVGASVLPYVGGNYSDADRAGPFYVHFSLSTSSTGRDLGSRLSYRL